MHPIELDSARKRIDALNGQHLSLAVEHQATPHRKMGTSLIRIPLCLIVKEHLARVPLGRLGRGDGDAKVVPGDLEHPLEYKVRAELQAGGGPAISGAGFELDCLEKIVPNAGGDVILNSCCCHVSSVVVG